MALTCRKAFQHGDRILARLDAADSEENRAIRQGEFAAQRSAVGGGTEALGVDAIADDGRADAACFLERLAPHRTDGKEQVGPVDGSILQLHQPDIGELVDMMDGADESRDQPALLQGCQCIAGDAVMGVENIEVAGRSDFRNA